MIPFSDEELIPVVQETLEKLEPQLALDGGGIKLLKIKDGKIYVQLQGACIGCSASGQTIKFGVERAIKMNIHPDLEVVNISPGMEHILDNI